MQPSTHMRVRRVSLALLVALSTLPALTRPAQAAPGANSPFAGMSQRDMWCQVLEQGISSPARKAHGRQECFGKLARFDKVRAWRGRVTLKRRYSCADRSGSETMHARFRLKRTPYVSNAEVTSAIKGQAPGAARVFQQAMARMQGAQVVIRRDPTTGYTESPSELSWFLTDGKLDASIGTHGSDGDTSHSENGSGSAAIAKQARLIFDLEQGTWSLELPPVDEKGFPVTLVTTNSEGTTTEHDRESLDDLNSLDGYTSDGGFNKLPARGLQLAGHATTHPDNCETDEISWHLSVLKQAAVELYRDETKITNKTIHAVVGQRIALTAAVNIDAATVGHGRWFIGGSPISDWKATQDSAEVVHLPPSAYTKRALTFYWWQPGSYLVRYQVRANGKLYGAEARFRVKRPRFTLTAKTLPGSYGVLRIVGGTRGSKPHARKSVDYVGNLAYIADGHTIVFTRSPIPAGFSGTTQFVQLVKTEAHGHRTSEGPLPSCLEEHDTHYLLDTTYPYADQGNVSQVVDAPGRDIYTFTKDQNVYMRLKMYLLFKPDTAGAIYVPLRYVSWWWKARLRYAKSIERPLRNGEDNSYAWYLKHTAVSVSRSPNPVSRRADAYPVWPAVSPPYMPACKH